jgi:hypothetical protein
MEYAIILSLVIAVFYAMNIYFKRGIQGKIKDMADGYISNEQSALTDDYVDSTANSSRGMDVSETETIYKGGGRRSKVDMPKAANIVDATSTVINKEPTFTGEYTPVEAADAPTVPVKEYK